VALAEGAVGAWLRRLPLGDKAQSWTLIVAWLAILLGLLSLRVLGSWGRDRAQELASLAEGDRFVRRVWSEGTRFPDRGPWRTGEGREICENGARARQVLMSSTISLVVLLPVMLWLSPSLSVALLALAPVVGWASRLRWRASKAWVAMEQTLLAHQSAQEAWAWRSVPEARSSGLAGLVARSRRSASRRIATARSGGVKILVRGQALTESAAHAAGWCLAALALLVWSRGHLSPADLLAFLAVSLLAYRPIREAGRALPAWHRYQALLQECVESTSAPETVPEGVLEVRQLRVWADDGALLVDGPTFVAPAGTTLLLSGANGSGKTSLLAGLASWKRADGICHRPARVRALAQEPVLPPLSPHQWSGCGNPTTLPMYRTLFPDGLPWEWSSPIPDGGSRLSRGERARLALLCLTARPADLWLFDEPFSALPYAERPGILEALRRIQGSTTLIFSDPLSIDPREAPVVWEPVPCEKGPRIFRL